MKLKIVLLICIAFTQLFSSENTNVPNIQCNEPSSGERIDTGMLLQLENEGQTATKKVILVK